jgi:putative ABC transport system permease protein
VFSYPMFRDLERQQEPFTGIAAHRMFDASLAFRGEAVPATGVLVSGSYFGVLGIQPALGRLLGPQDDAAEGSAEAVVLSHHYWQNTLGADPSVVGEALVVNGKPMTVVGVAAQDFSGTTRPLSPAVFVPITFHWLDAPNALPPNFDDRRNYWLYLFGRLKPGISGTAAETAINATYRPILDEIEAPLQTGMTEQQLTQFRAKTITVTPGARGQSWIVRDSGVPLSILLVSAATVLLIACVNIANLMLARGATRVGEMAVRLSLGAAPRRLVALLFTEAVLASLLAAAASLPVTLLMLQWAGSMVPAYGAASVDVSLNAKYVAIAIAAALVSAATFSLYPILKLSATRPGLPVRGNGSLSIGKTTSRFRTALVTAQVAMATMLLVLAGLLAQSLANVTRVDLGLRTESLLSFSISPERNGYARQDSITLLDSVEREVGALAGVTSVSSALVPLLAGNSVTRNVRIPGFEPAAGTLPLAHFNGVGEGFFDTLGIALVAGRHFEPADAGLDRPKVAIVNERFVERFALGSNAVGTRLGIVEGDIRDIEIVGVVANAKYNNVKDPIRAQLFMPRDQVAAIAAATFYVRHSGAAESVLDGIRAVVARLDPSLPFTTVQTMDGQIRENVFGDRFMGILGAALAAVATLLAVVGIYGTLSYMVTQRTREIGLHIALGAPPARLRGMIVGQIGAMASIGGVMGVGAAVLIGQAASVLLFGVQPFDPLVLISAISILAAVVLAAAWLPARRAAGVDPIVALRAD